MASIDSQIVTMRNSTPSPVERRRIDALTKPEIADISGNVSVSR